MSFADQPWQAAFTVGLAIFVGIRHVFSERAKVEEKVIRRVDGLERTLLAMVGVGTLLLPLLYVFTPILDSADYSQPAVLPWLGTGAMVISLWLFWRSHADLGINWSISLEVRREHELIKHGVYSRIRHPMYTAIWLWGIAQALMLPNWIAGFSALATFAPMYVLRVPREETLMCESFGDAYEQYMGETGRVLPCFGRRNAGG